MESIEWAAVAHVARRRRMASCLPGCRTAVPLLSDERWQCFTLAPRIGGETAPLDLRILPPSCIARIFGALPVDLRLRCLGVCRTWRIALGGNARVWQDLDLSPAGGCARECVGESLLLAAAARAGYHLSVLDVTDCGSRISPHALSRVCFYCDFSGLGQSKTLLRLSGVVPIRHARKEDPFSRPLGDFAWLVQGCYCAHTGNGGHGGGHYGGNMGHIAQAAAAGPSEFEADVLCENDIDACDALRYAAATSPHVHVRRLFVTPFGLDASGAALRLAVDELNLADSSLAVSSLRDLCAAAAAHAPLQELHVMYAAPSDGNDAVLRTVQRNGLLGAAARLRVLTVCCTSFYGGVLELQHGLLQHSAVEEITLVGRGREKYQQGKNDQGEEDVPMRMKWRDDCTKLAASLRASTQLRMLHLQALSLWSGDEPALATLLPALVAHPTLAALTLCDDRISARYPRTMEAAQGAAGELLETLLLANTAALTSLDVSFCALGAAGLRRLASALPANTHLRALRCAGNVFGDGWGWGNPYTAERDIMLPAVLNNTSLRSLDSLSSWACEVDPLLRSRSDAPLPSPAELLVERRRAAYLRGNCRLEMLGRTYRA